MARAVLKSTQYYVEFSAFDIDLDPVHACKAEFVDHIIEGLCSKVLYVDQSPNTKPINDTRGARR
jgi:hypothetical protein